MELPARIELKVPPPIVFLVSAGVMWFIAGRGLLTLYEKNPASTAVAVALAIVGLLIGSAALAAFHRAGTTFDPRTPGDASALVRSGIYKHTRNPIYLGMATVLTGWAVYLGSAAAAALVPGFILYINTFQIRPEERALQAIFGQAYDEYRRTVRRWL